MPFSDSSSRIVAAPHDVPISSSLDFIPSFPPVLLKHNVTVMCMLLTFGDCVYVDGSMYVDGSLYVDDCSVGDCMYVDGSLYVDDCSVGNSLYVDGSVYVDDCSVCDSVYVDGSLYVDNCDGSVYGFTLT